jgi:hypothetical protein
MSLHIWRNIYYYMGWEYKAIETTERIKRNRHEVMVQIRSYGDNIKDAVLKEEGEVRESKSFKLKDKSNIIERIEPPTTDFLSFEGGYASSSTKKRKRKRKRSNNYSF